MAPEDTLAKSPCEEVSGCRLSLVGGPIPDNMLAICEQAIVELPDDFTSRLTYGEFLALSGQHDAAIREWRHAIRIDPACLFPWVLLAGSYEQLGNLDEAINAYQEALGLPENQPGVGANARHSGKGLLHYKLYQLLKQKGLSVEAHQHLEATAVVEREALQQYKSDARFLQYLEGLLAEGE